MIILQVRIQRSAGRSLGDSPQSISAEMIAQNIASIEDFSDPAYPVNAGDAFPALMSARGQFDIWFINEESSQ